MQRDLQSDSLAGSSETSSTVAVVTGTRAEFGLLAGCIVGLREGSCSDVQVIVAGMHLVAEHGATWQEVAGSASGGGISNSHTNSSQPRISIYGRYVCVTWVEDMFMWPHIDNKDVAMRCAAYK